jgi:hypothetical protein
MLWLGDALMLDKVCQWSGVATTTASTKYGAAAPLAVNATLRPKKHLREIFRRVDSGESLLVFAAIIFRLD